VSHTADDVERLLTSDARVSLFPDVREGLQALRERYTLAVLSNGDLDSLERVISAEQAGVYKPHQAVYGSAVKEMGLEKEQVLNVAAHTWDIHGAKAFGLLGAYLNRDNVPYGTSHFQADLEVSRLTDLASRFAN
jgi:2-haloacid dehalogenase